MDDKTKRLSELASALSQPTQKAHEDEAEYTTRLVGAAATVSEPRWLSLKPELQALVNDELARGCGGVRS